MLVKNILKRSYAA